jgi:hypothetical protein
MFPGPFVTETSCLLPLKLIAVAVVAAETAGSTASELAKATTANPARRTLM